MAEVVDLSSEVDQPVVVTDKRRGSRSMREPMSREDRENRWPSLKTLAGPPTKQGEEAWMVAFTLHPDAFYRMLQDVIKQTYAVPGRIGQRPMPKEEAVDLEALLYGDFAEDPLTVVLPKLLHGQSERAFCQRIFMSRTQFQRLLRGEYAPNLEELRLIAHAVKKPAAYFIEYRVQAAQIAFQKLLVERPALATKLYRNFLEVKAPIKKMIPVVA